MGSERATSSTSDALNASIQNVRTGYMHLYSIAEMQVGSYASSNSRATSRVAVLQIHWPLQKKEPHPKKFHGSFSPSIHTKALTSAFGINLTPSLLINGFSWKESNT